MYDNDNNWMIMIQDDNDKIFLCLNGCILMYVNNSCLFEW